MKPAPCFGCRDGEAVDFPFAMAFQPIVDMRTREPFTAGLTQRLQPIQMIDQRRRSVPSAADGWRAYLQIVPEVPRLEKGKEYSQEAAAYPFINTDRLSR